MPTIENKLDPTVSVKQIEITPYSDNSNESLDNYFQERYGIKINDIGKMPLVWYNGIYISPNNIHSFYLSSEQFFPVLQIYFSDDTNQMINKAFAQDNTKISIFIDSRTKDKGNSSTLRNIRMDFKIVDYSYMEDDDVFYVQGVPDVDGLYLQDIKSYDMNGFECLKEVAKNTKLGYRSNISETNDKMKWLNTNMENFQFIQDTTKNIYKSDNSFFTSFIDFYYNLNLVDVETALKEDINQVKSVLSINNEGIEEENQEVQDLYLVSSKYYDNRYNNKYESYEILNNSTKVSLNNGYRTNLFYYDRTGNWDQKGGSFLRFTMETNTNNDGIILKSYIKDDKKDGFFNTNSKSEYLPMLDIDNTYKNYNYANLLNEKNIQELDKITIKVNLREPNFNFYKYQKIKLFIMNAGFGEELQINQRLTGGWLIKAINFYYDNNTLLNQELIMVKRELTANDISV